MESSLSTASPSCLEFVVVVAAGFGRNFGPLRLHKASAVGQSHRPYNVILCEVSAALTGLHVSNIHVEAATPGTRRARRPPERGMLSAAPQAWPLFSTVCFRSVASESRQSLRRGESCHTRCGRDTEKEREAALYVSNRNNRP